MRVVYSPDWKDGKPTANDKGISHCFKKYMLDADGAWKFRTVEGWIPKNRFTPNGGAKERDNISSSETLARELRPFAKIRDAYPKMLISRTRHEEYDREGVRILNVADWLSKEIG